MGHEVLINQNISKYPYLPELDRIQNLDNSIEREESCIFPKANNNLSDWDDLAKLFQDQNDFINWTKTIRFNKNNDYPQDNYGSTMDPYSEYGEKQFKDPVLNRIMLDPAERARIESIARNIKSSFGLINDNAHIKSILTELEKQPDGKQKLAALEMIYGELNGNPAALRHDLKSNLGSIGDKHSRTGLGSWKSAAPWLTGAAGIAMSFIPGLNVVGIPLAIASFGLGAYKTTQDKAVFSSGDAIDILNKGAVVDPRTAAIALRESMEGSGTDEVTVHQIMNRAKKSDIGAIALTYEKLFGTTLAGDIGKDFYGTPSDKQKYQAMINKGLSSAPSEEERIQAYREEIYRQQELYYQQQYGNANLY